MKLIPILLLFLLGCTSHKKLSTKIPEEYVKVNFPGDHQILLNLSFKDDYLASLQDIYSPSEIAIFDDSLSKIDTYIKYIDKYVVLSEDSTKTHRLYKDYAQWLHAKNELYILDANNHPVSRLKYKSYILHTKYDGRTRYKTYYLGKESILVREE
jgi:hypothetical protein